MKSRKKALIVAAVVAALWPGQARALTELTTADRKSVV